ncbi:TRAP-type C4-dicarboxylate transport system permease small subunit [Luteimonas cucumeris]|uniref:TRAP transporter small permease protein n=1 Tax=Luteimonas cucumeris TaxID=985012 RepID=A0A562LDR5_9GAMM|nr:TRAP-type C4-dicarboxylate transport system permease small subunit [Luteimonas cucumeris]
MNIEQSQQSAIADTAPPSTWHSQLARLSTWIAGLALVAMAAVQAWQVFARYVLNASPDWTEPVALLLLNFAMMFGAAVGVHAESHFGFFIARQAAPPRIGRALLAFNRALIAMVGALLAWWGAWLAADSWEVPMAGARIPEGMFYLPLCLGGALMASFALQHLFAGKPSAQGH